MKMHNVLSLRETMLSNSTIFQPQVEHNHSRLVESMLQYDRSLLTVLGTAMYTLNRQRKEKEKLRAIPDIDVTAGSVPVPEYVPAEKHSSDCYI